jgi:hypothetical protein
MPRCGVRVNSPGWTTFLVAKIRYEGLLASSRYLKYFLAKDLWPCRSPYRVRQLTLSSPPRWHHWPCTHIRRQCNGACIQYLGSLWDHNHISSTRVQPFTSKRMSRPCSSDKTHTSPRKVGVCDFYTYFSFLWALDRNSVIQCPSRFLSERHLV